MKIWKYEIPEKDRFTLEIPGNPRFLNVGVQRLVRPVRTTLGPDLRDGLPPQPRDVPVLWAMIPKPDAEPRPHTFRVVATGEDFDLPLQGAYVGTFQIGMFVGHIFHLPERNP